MEANILQAVKTFVPVLGAQPVAVWDAAREGAQRAADVLPDSLEPVKNLLRKRPVLATCVVLAVGGVLSGRLGRPKALAAPSTDGS